jgi:hypothetical protein
VRKNYAVAAGGLYLCCTITAVSVQFIYGRRTIRPIEKGKMKKDGDEMNCLW